MAEIPKWQEYIVFAWPRGDRDEPNRHFSLIAAKKSEAESRVRKHLGPGERGNWSVVAYVARTYLKHRQAPAGTVDLDLLEEEVG